MSCQKTFNRPFFNLCLSAVVLSSPSLVQATQAADDTVVVTATRTSQTVNESVSTVKVVSRDDIIRRQAKSVPELLQGLTGVHFVNNGGRGKTTSLFIRGTNSDHVLVLIDGVKVGSASSGSTPFQDLSIESIDRIELISGPRSSLYGSEAIGGVIQIFTRKGDGELRPSFKISAGSYDSYETAASVSGGSEYAHFSVGASATRINGFDSCQAEAAGVGGCFVDQADKDGYESQSGFLTAGLKSDNGSGISLTSSFGQNESEFDGSFQDNGESRQYFVGLGSNLIVSDSYWVKVNVGRSVDKTDNFLGDSYSSSFNTVRDTASLQNDLVISDTLMLTLGGDYQRDDVDTKGSGAYQADDRENWGAFTQFLLSEGRHDLELSARYDDNDQFGAHLTKGVGYGFALAEGLRLVSSFGTAFKAPSFNELYYPFYGKADLNPEESRSFEAGLKGSTPSGDWSLMYFASYIDELIAYDSTTFSANNIDDAKIKGLEFAFDQSLNEHWQLGLDLTLQNPTNESPGANQGNQLARRPKKSGLVQMSYAETDWSAGIDFNFRGTAYDNLANTREIKASRTVDLRGQIEVAENWLLQAEVENLFGSYSETISFYNQPEQAVYVTLRYEP